MCLHTSPQERINNLHSSFPKRGGKQTHGMQDLIQIETETESEEMHKKGHVPNERERPKSMLEMRQGPGS